MNTNNKQLWLIRVFAFLILIVLFGKFLEGAAFNLVVAMSASAIILWTFMFQNK